MIVIDASAMIEFLLGTELGDRVRERTGALSRSWHAPHLLDIEVAQTLRRFLLSKQVDRRRVVEALDDLKALRLRRHGHSILLHRVLELHANLTAYDAVYLALAEALEATLITCDAGLAKAPRSRIEVELIA